MTKFYGVNPINSDQSIVVNNLKYSRYVCLNKDFSQYAVRMSE